MTRFYDMWFRVGSYLNLVAKHLSLLSMVCLSVGAGFGTTASGKTDSQVADESIAAFTSLAVLCLCESSIKEDNGDSSGVWNARSVIVRSSSSSSTVCRRRFVRVER